MYTYDNIYSTDTVTEVKEREMKAIDKVTGRNHEICPVLGGFQVCLIPDMAWEDAKISDIHVFMNEDFDARFELVK